MFGFSISHTTRQPRMGEEPDVHYHFISKEKFQSLVDENQFVEYAKYANNLYGTSKQSIEDIAKLNKVCVMDIDSQGVDQLLQTDLLPNLILVKAPSLDILEQRLRIRATDDDGAISKRLAIAKKELTWAETQEWHLTLVNDDFETSYQALLAYLKTQYPALNK